MGMKIITLLFIILNFLSSSIHATTLKPSEIEALQQEFESLDKYNSAPSYSMPENTNNPNTAPNQPNTQFVDLDSVFKDEMAPQTAPQKRKRL